MFLDTDGGMNGGRERERQTERRDRKERQRQREQTQQALILGTFRAYFNVQLFTISAVVKSNLQMKR